MVKADADKKIQYLPLPIATLEIIVLQDSILKIAALKVSHKFCDS